MANHASRLILASSSRYRKEMLKRFGIPFETISPDIDETPQPGETPARLALRLSVEKALAIAENNPNSIIIGSDQVATLDGAPIGKPGNFEAAKKQLRALSGHCVEFHSALAVTNGGMTETADIITRCYFRELSDAEIVHYLEIEKPFDTAGSAKAEGLGITLMDKMESEDPTSIIGLPLITLARMLRSFGINPTLSAQGNQHHD
ncbi:MAG: Maf family nucleotide pyrophosphatase [Advenella sp.]|jgi:septum formation protein|nr:Maf family nucleotide pyrophosphatase [Advenella sp.]